MISKRDNYSLGCAGLAAGTAGSVSIVNPLAYAVDGRSYYKAAAANVALALLAGSPAAINLAANQATVIYFHLDIAGNLFYTQGKVVSSSTAAGYNPGAFEWPQENKGSACIGAVKVTTNASGAFTIGTTVFAAANTTATFYNAANDYGVAIPY